MNFRSVNLFLLLIGLIALTSVSAQAETLRKRYTFDFNPTTRRSSEQKAQNLSKERFVKDFLADKFSKEIVDNLDEEISIALEPLEDYLLTFNVVNSKENGDKLTVTVEGDVDLPGMITALVQNKVLSFGERPPKVMFLAAPRLEASSGRAAKNLRALLFDKLRQAGLQSVAAEGITETLSTQIKGKITANSSEFRVLQKLVTQYGADYLIYVDSEVDNRPASIGGYICNANFIYTVLRPNNNVILGESLISEQGSGNSSMIAFDKTLDKAAPTILSQAIGQLYQSIYADSDVIYNTVQQRNSIAVTVYEAKSEQVQKIINALQASGATVTLGSGTGISSKLTVETTLDTLGLYNFFNSQSISTNAGTLKTPVVGYAENTIDIEVTENKPPKRTASTTPPKPRPSNNTGSGGDRNSTDNMVSQLKSRNKPAVVFKLKPLTYNK